jgi:hypothetical protein
MTDTTALQSAIYKKLKAIPAASKAAFFSAVILAYAVHLWVFTNLIPNSDGIDRIFDEQEMTVSGRWFLTYVTRLTGSVEAPALLGFVSVLALALTAAVVVDVLGIRTRAGGIFTGAFLVVSTALAYTYGFMFTSAAYAIAILMSAVSVQIVLHGFGYNLRRSETRAQSRENRAHSAGTRVAAAEISSRRKAVRFLAATVILCCSLGIYQAYLGISLALWLGWIILSAVDREQKTQSFRHILTVFAMIAAASVLYYVVLKIFLAVKHLELLSYHGMNTFASSLSASFVATRMLRVYADFVRQLFIPGSEKYITLPMNVLNVLLAVLFLVTLFRLIRHSGKKYSAVSALLALLCLPAACNFPEFLDSSAPHMRYPMVMLYVLLMALLDLQARQTTGQMAEKTTRQTEDRHANIAHKETGVSTEPAGSESVGVTAQMSAGTLRKTAWTKATFAEAVVSLLLFAYLLVTAQFCNRVYTALETAHQATQSFLTTLATRIESTEGYHSDMDVIIIGTPSTSILASGVPEFDEISVYQGPADSVLKSTKHIYYYLEKWLNIPWEEPSEETMKEVSDSELFKSLPIYPDDGSIVIDGNRVIVRLSEAYKPKTEMELAYEQRH